MVLHFIRIEREKRSTLGANQRSAGGVKSETTNQRSLESVILWLIDRWPRQSVDPINLRLTLRIRRGRSIFFFKSHPIYVVVSSLGHQVLPLKRLAWWQLNFFKMTSFMTNEDLGWPLTSSRGFIRSFHSKSLRHYEPISASNRIPTRFRKLFSVNYHRWTVKMTSL